jgi:hypothetical protein
VQPGGLTQVDLRPAGGYTDLAMVADVHPIIHPRKTRRNLLRVASLD